VEQVEPPEAGSADLAAPAREVVHGEQQGAGSAVAVVWAEAVIQVVQGTDWVAGSGELDWFAVPAGVEPPEARRVDWVAAARAVVAVELRWARSLVLEALAGVARPETRQGDWVVPTVADLAEEDWLAARAGIVRLGARRAGWLVLEALAGVARPETRQGAWVVPTVADLAEEDWLAARAGVVRLGARRAGWAVPAASGFASSGLASFGLAGACSAVARPAAALLRPATGAEAEYSPPVAIQIAPASLPSPAAVGKLPARTGLIAFPAGLESASLDPSPAMAIVAEMLQAAEAEPS